MAQINNKEVMQKLAETANIQIAKESIPNQLAEKIVPTFECNPNLLRKNIVLGAASSAATGSITALTTEPTKKTFLTGIHFSFIKDATCDIATGAINILFWPKGKAAVNAIGLAVISLTAQNQEFDFSFKDPIELEAGKQVSCAVSYAAGVMSRCLTAIGYVEEAT